MSKGSSRRPTDDEKFVVNFDRIFNNKKENADGSESNTENAKKIERKRRISSRASRGKVERICKD